MKVENLLESLKIQDKSLVTCLNSIEEEMKEFWDSPLLQHYTKHGLDHSQRIIENLGNLLKGYPNLLNERERFILLASVYLHDIGMQSPRHAGLPYKSEYTLEELEKVRENHHEASAKMITESISKTSDISLGLEHCKDYARFIATLSRYHRKLNINEVDKSSLAGEVIRLPLLIALLRLSDALDQDCRRVNMKILKLRDIPVQSKFYWWSHHYVGSILIEGGKIKLYFRFPEKYRGDKVIEVFRDKVYESVRRQFLEVYDMLDRYGVRLYRDVIIEEENYTPEGELDLLPNDLLEYINENILKTIERSQEKTVQTGVIWFVDGVPYSDDAEVIKCLITVFKFIDEGRNFDAVKEIERCHILTMAPKERMIFSGIAGSCYYILGNFSRAEEYYKDILKISERKDLRAVYKNDVILARAAALGNSGVIYGDKGDLDEAFKYHQEALKIHKGIGYKQGEATELGSIGVIHRAKGDLDEALKYLKEALKIDKEVGYKQGEAIDLGNIGVIYDDKGDLDEAFKYHQEALKIDREIGYKQGEAYNLGYLGLIHRAKGDLDEALKYLKEALTIVKEIGHKQGEAMALNNIGLIYGDKGDLDEALKYTKEALKINKEIGYKQEEATALNNIGLIYGNKGDLDEAFKYHQEALKIDREIGYKQGEAYNLGYIGLIHRAKGDLDEALKYTKEALKNHKEIGHKQGEATTLNNIGLIYSDKGDLDEALKYTKEALKINKEIGYKQEEATALNNIGLIYGDKGDLDGALKYLKDALEIFNIAAPGWSVQILNNIATIYFKKQNYEIGFENLARAISSSSSLEQFNKVLSLFLRTVRELIIHNEWENLDKIHSTYTSGIITDKIWLNFFMAIHEYAIYRKTNDASHKKDYKAARQKLNPNLKKLLDELLEVKR